MTGASATKWFYYRSFGLTIKSDIELSGPLPVQTDRHDIEIVRSTSVTAPEPMAADIFEFSPERQLLVWGRVGRVEVFGEERVEYALCPDTDPSLASFPILGPVFGLLLHLRGLLVLHASALMLDAGAVILLGDKGAGKSTTAAAMIAADLKLMSDDLVVIRRDDGGQFTVLPSYPQLKLTEKSMSAFAQSKVGPSSGPHALLGKHILTLPDSFSNAPASAATAVVLRRGDAASISDLSQSEALNAILKFSYASRYDLTKLSKSIAARHLGLCAQFVAAVRVGLLTVPSEISNLGTAIALLKKEFAVG